MSRIWRSTQGRLLLIFFVTLLPVYIVGMYIHSWGVSTMRQSVAEQSLNRLVVYTGALENDIARLVGLQTELLNSNDLAWLANMNSVMSNYERGKAVNDLQRRLLYLYSSSTYSTGAFACLPSLQIAIEGASGMRAITELDQHLLELKRKQTGLPVFDLNGQIYTSLAFRIRDSKAIYNVTARISSEQIQKDLKQFDYNSGISVAILNSGAVSLASGSLDEAQAQEAGLLLLRQIEAADAGLSSWLDFRLNGTEYLALYSRAQKMDLTVCNLIPRHVLYEPTDRYMTMLWIYIITGLVVLLLFAAFVRQSIHRPLHKLVSAFQEVESNNLTFTLDYTRNDEYGYLFGQFNQMLKNLSNLIQQSYEQTIMIRNAELKQLQAQINPHFLYNSYFLLHRMILREDSAKAALFSSYMGKYFQYITRNASPESTLEQEAGHAGTYADIQALRFDGRIRVEFGALPMGFAHKKIPRLILQPIIENAFEHGLRDKKSDGLLRVMFRAEHPNALLVLVEDNGDCISQAQIELLNSELNLEHRERTAIRNIHYRLRLRHGNGSGLHFSRSELGGLRVEMIVEFKETDDDTPFDR